jgi:hypothetical protein
MTLAYGLDLAGKCGATFAKRIHSDLVEVTVIRNHVFSETRKSDAPLADITRQQATLLRAWAAGGTILVDIPIDLQGLPSPTNPQFIWELTRRPVDFAFNAMPPLADRIGAPVARFQHLLATLPDDWVGTRIFETYPAESLRLMGLHDMGYKGQSAQFTDGQWRGVSLAEILNRMSVLATEGMQINDDEFDAMICALAGVASDAERLAGDAMHYAVDTRIRQRITDAPETPYTAPPSFVLLRTLPQARITLSAQQSDSGMLY